MKSGLLRILIAVVVVVVCIGLIYFARQKTDTGSSVPNNFQTQSTQNAPEPASAREQSKIVAITPSQKDDAAARVSALRKSHRAATDNLSTTLMLSEAEQLAEATRARNAETDQNLIDSITSLTQQVVNDPSSTTGVIELLKEEDDPQLMILIAQALGEGAAVMGEAFPYDLLLEVALNDPDLARREAALLTLSYMRVVPDDLRLGIAEISQSAPTPQLRSAAIDTMGQWMNNIPDLAPSISEALLGAREASNHPLVRGMVIQTIGNSNAPLSPKVFDAMNDALRNETVAGNRSLAAVALGSGATPDNRESVIDALEAGYQAESELVTRRHIITQIAKAAKGDAAIYLQQLPTPDPLLAQDVADYVEIIRGSNQADWGAIWEQKSERDSQRGTDPNSHGGHN